MAVILVVDDEIGIRELLSEILSDEGYGVLLAENASAARSAMTQHPDLVVKIYSFLARKSIGAFVFFSSKKTFHL